MMGVGGGGRIMSVLKTDSRAKRAFVFVMARNRDVKQNEVIIITGEVVTARSWLGLLGCIPIQRAYFLIYL